MADSTARYYQGQPATSVSTLATVPAATQWNVRQIHLANTSALAASITIYLVPSGNSAAAANAIALGYVVQPNSVAQITGLFPMAVGETIQALQGTASAITMTVTGVTTA